MYIYNFKLRLALKKLSEIIWVLKNETYFGAEIGRFEEFNSEIVPNKCFAENIDFYHIILIE